MTMLKIADLSVSLSINGRHVPIVQNINMEVNTGEVLGVAGESGSGKTVSAMAVMGLLPKNAIVTGRIEFEGRNLLELSERELRRVRGREIGMIFQDPLSSLHPMMPIGSQLTDHFRAHQGASRTQAKARAVELLDLVRLPNPDKTMKAFPHQLSGGMRQRVAIASALACNPKMIIADEPTTALDVTVQAGVIELLKSLTRELGLGVMIVTHDLGVLSTIADRLAVFYAGGIVETAPKAAMFGSAKHPYTEALLRAVPHQSGDGVVQLRPMRGSPPGAGEWPMGCRFSDRCDHATDACTSTLPVLTEVLEGHAVACHLRGVAS